MQKMFFNRKMEWYYLNCEQKTKPCEALFFLLYFNIACKESEKKMFQCFYPDEYYMSAYDINYENLYEKGYRGIIFDIDNTLVPHGAPADERSILLFKKLKRIGYDALLLSNNKEERVNMFNELIGVHTIHKANKPFPEKYKEAMNVMHTDETNTIFIGDQLFTDVWGAKKAGIRTFLVKPMNPKEEIQIVIKRKLERIVLYFYFRQQKRK